MGILFLIEQSVTEPHGASVLWINPAQNREDQKEIVRKVQNWSCGVFLFFVFLD